MNKLDLHLSSEQNSFVCRGFTVWENQVGVGVCVCVCVVWGWGGVFGGFCVCLHPPRSRCQMELDVQPMHREKAL